jgi:hypothetical protein
MHGRRRWVVRGRANQPQPATRPVIHSFIRTFLSEGGRWWAGPPHPCYAFPNKKQRETPLSNHRRSWPLDLVTQSARLFTVWLQPTSRTEAPALWYCTALDTLLIRSKTAYWRR